jgi:hypothetical protein
MYVSMSGRENQSQEQSVSEDHSRQGETPGPDERYCTSCRAIIKEEASICPECGVSQNTSGGTTQSESTTAGGPSADGFEQRISDLQVEGWEIKDRTNDKAVMINRKTGTLMAHIVIFILLCWWTLGVANGIYFGYKYFLDVDKQVIRR